MKRATRSHRGYSLVIVLMTLGLITVSLLSLYAYLDGSAKSTGELINKRRSFYVCDGMTRILGRLVSDYSKTVTGAPTAAGAEAYIHLRASDPPAAENLTKILPDGYRLDMFTVSRLERLGDRVAIPNGPFEGMIARETDLTFSIRARSADGLFACRIDQTLALSELGLFQFALFGAVDEMPAAVATSGSSRFLVTGRIHANGRLCVGSTSAGQGLYAHAVTAAGSIFHASDNTVCLQSHSALFPNLARIWNGTGTVFDPTPTSGLGTPANWGTLSNVNDGNEATWAADALTDWSGRVRDQAHGVGPLVAPFAPAAQAAQTAGGAARAQDGDLRFLVDPPLASDSTAEKRSRLAYLADLRIIDGVWYLRDLSNPDNWPGIPIWSDHPGRAIDHVSASFGSRQPSPGARQVDVGQEDLRAARSWPSTPQRFSYYGFDVGTMSFARGGGAPLATPAVISYGLLERVAGPPISWRPAVVTPQDSSGPPDPMNKIGACGAPCAATGACGPDTVNYPISAASTAMCGAGEKNTSSLLAMGTRGVFYDARMANGTTSDDVRPYLPTNFDVAAFQNALSDTSGRELGSYFTGGRTFNGIVWISSLWPGAWDGFPNAAPTRAAAAFSAVPFPLCSDNLVGSFDTAPAIAAPTAIPTCASRMASSGVYAGDSVYAWSNAVRVVNANVLDATLLTSGLTIATNLPMWLIGPANTTSDAALTEADAIADEAVPTPWLPFLVAGDVVSLGSSDWQDAAFARKGALTDVLSPASWAAAVPDAATSTEWRAAILTGLPYTSDRTKHYVDLKAAVRFPEQWSPIAIATIRGAVAVGYQPVYTGPYAGEMNAAFSNSPFGLSAYPDELHLVFDHRMGRIDTQPPGAVSFDVQSVRAWERR